MSIRTMQYTKFPAMLLLILTCAGCLKTPISRPKNLKPLTKETAQDTQTKEQVTAYSKKLTDAEQEETFGKSAQQQLQKYNIVPVQLTLENNGTTCWVVADKNIALDKLTIDQVNTKLFASYRLRPLWIFLGGMALAVIAGPLIGFAFIPAVGFPANILCFYAYATIATGILFTATSCVAAIDGTITHLSKKQMQEYLKNHCCEDSIALDQGMTASMLFFVEESKMPSDLSFLLVDKDLEKHALNFQMGI